MFIAILALIGVMFCLLVATGVLSTVTIVASGIVGGLLFLLILLFIGLQAIGVIPTRQV